jgi:AcrR family transcriptional regulator
MELYGERGFESTTVAEIASRAGLTERTFFRYFTDKREVLFWGSRALQDLLVTNVDDAPAGLAPMDTLVAALVQVAIVFFEERRDFSRRRQAIIVANEELRERELIKLASLASALADALRRRGVADPAAGLAAEAGIAIFKVAFESWVDDSSDLTLADTIQNSAEELKAVTAPRKAAGRR